MPNTFPIQEWPVLETLLRVCSEHATEATPFRVAADYAEEHGVPGLAWLLRYLAGHPRHILFTGSRRYGTPKPDSDFDWVIRMSDADSRWCAAHADEVKGMAAAEEPTDDATTDEYPWTTRGGPGVSPYAGSGLLDSTLRFGPVNLLVVNNTDQLGCWERGTGLLAGEAPVTRGRAVEVFQGQLADLQARWQEEAAEYEAAMAEQEAEYARYRPRRRYRGDAAYARHIGEV